MINTVTVHLNGSYPVNTVSDHLVSLWLVPTYCGNSHWLEQLWSKFYTNLTINWHNCGSWSEFYMSGFICICFNLRVDDKLVHLWYVHLYEYCKSILHIHTLSVNMKFELVVEFYKIYYLHSHPDDRFARNISQCKVRWYNRKQISR